MTNLATATITENPLKIIQYLGKDFAKRAAEYDQKGTFVYRNYEDLKAHQLFAALVPKELGGLGISYTDLCQMVRTMAHYCGSTALAFSMHQHLVAATVWKYRHKGVGEATLRKVADQQIILVSTGARDWLGSNGELKKVEGGYLFSAKKSFASQSSFGDIAVTSAPYQNEVGEWKVLHFQVSLKADGVSVLEDWQVMGMRGTASHSLLFDQVFIPESAIALERNKHEFHPVWNVVLTVAMPLIMSAYVGLAERAVEIAIEIGKKYPRNKAHLKYIIGKLNNQLLAAQTQWKAMLQYTNDLDFSIAQDNTTDILSLKTNVSEACTATVAEAMDAIGGQSFYEKNELERIFRDVQAGKFHPLPKWEQYSFTGGRLLNIEAGIDC